MDKQPPLLKRIVTLIIENDISKFSYISKDNNSDIYQTAWWNMKWYNWQDKRNRLNGSQLQSFNFKNDKISEIPYNKKYGYPSDGRFSSSSNEISYWTNNYDLAVLESKKWNNQYGFPANRFIRKATKLLDLSSIASTFLEIMKKENLIEDILPFYTDTLLGDNDEDIRITKTIGQAAFKKGFHGIIWQSAKLKDLMKQLGGQVCQKYCMVLFYEYYLLESPE